MRQHEIDRSTYVGNLLIQRYSRLGRLEEAQCAFDRIEQPNVYSWNILLSAYASTGHISGAMLVFDQMPVRNIVSWNSLAGCILQAGYPDSAREFCSLIPFWSSVTGTIMILANAGLGDYNSAKGLFDSMFDRAAVSWNSVIQAFVSTSQLELAELYFDRIPQRQTITWNSMIQANASKGDLERASETFRAIPEPDVVSYTTMINAAGSRDPEEARRFFDETPTRNVISWNSLISAYVKHEHLGHATAVFNASPGYNSSSSNTVLQGLIRHGKLHEAGDFFWSFHRNGVSWSLFLKAHVSDFRLMKAIFDRMPSWDVSSWNLMIRECSECGHIDRAVKLFCSMPRRDLFSWTTLATSLAQRGLVREAEALFLLIPAHDLVVSNAMIAFYGKEDLHTARELFHGLPRRDMSSWFAMLTAECESGKLEDAWEVFNRTPEHDVLCSSVLISACVSGGDPESARELFDDLPERNIMCWNSMLTADDALMGDSSHAELRFSLMPQWDTISCNTMLPILADGRKSRNLFDSMPQRDVISWTTLVNSEKGGASKEVFEKMPMHNTISWNSLLTWDDLEAESLESTFNSMPGRDSTSWNSLASGYSRAGDLDKALEAIDRMPCHTIVSWNSLIAGLVQHSRAGEAWDLFRRLELEGNMESDEVTLLLLVLASSRLADMSLGNLVHQEIVSSTRSITSFMLLRNSVVQMFGRCGCLRQAREAFEEITPKNVVSWNTILTTYSSNGEFFSALSLFHAMLLDGISPDAITFVAMLAACSHGGRLATVLELFRSMSVDHDVAATPDHYACVVDALARAGLLDAAEELTCHAPLVMDDMTWMSVIGACSYHGDARRGSRAFHQLVNDNSCVYILLSNATLKH